FLTSSVRIRRDAASSWLVSSLGRPSPSPNRLISQPLEVSGQTGDRAVQGETGVGSAENVEAVPQFFRQLAGVEPATVRVIGEQTREVRIAPEAGYAPGPPPEGAERCDFSNSEVLHRTCADSRESPKTPRWTKRPGGAGSWATGPDSWGAARGR